MKWWIICTIIDWYYLTILCDILLQNKVSIISAPAWVQFRDAVTRFDIGLPHFLWFPRCIAGANGFTQVVQNPLGLHVSCCSHDDHAHGKLADLPVGDAHCNESPVSRLHAHFRDSASLIDRNRLNLANASLTKWIHSMLEKCLSECANRQSI